MHKCDESTNLYTQGLFDGVSDQYDLPAQFLSFFQYLRWRRFLTSRLKLTSGDSVMDLCTGTGGVAIQVARTYGNRVLGVDLSPKMVRQARRAVSRSGLDDTIDLALGRAESLPFSDGGFDAACFTFLLRYVDNPEAILRETVRVLKPGGRLASLEFGVPENWMARCLWYAYTRGVLPLATFPISRGWRRVGSLLGPSISRFYRDHSIATIKQMWFDSGIRDAQVKHLSLGGAVVIWGTKSVR